METLRDWLIVFLRELPKYRKSLETATNQQQRYFIERSIADRERLLSQLDRQERFVIERVLINREKACSLQSETGLTVKEIYQIKEETLEKLCFMRYGAAYRP